MPALGDQDSLARAADVVGDRWTLLILRDIIAGRSQFDDLQNRLSITRTMLADRLRVLVNEGLLERVPSSQGHAYRLTPKGNDIRPVLTALEHWGDQHITSPRPSARSGPPGGGCLAPSS